MAYKSPAAIKEAAYEKQNRKMRANKRRVSFACRFAGMAGALKDAKGEPTKLKMALKKWGFGSKEAARNFCNKNKSKK
jgi:hypothetical protein